MRIFFFIIYILSCSLSFAQDYENDAEYELLGYLKNYENFNIDSLTNKKFKFIREVRNYIPIEKKIIERNIDFNWKESIYLIGINYDVNRIGNTKIFKIYTYHQNDSIVGIVIYDERRMKKNYYFNYKNLANFIEDHNDFYNVDSNIESFVNDKTSDETYNNCGENIYEIPRYNNNSYNDKSKTSIFEKMLKSYNTELQTNAVDAFEYLWKHDIIKKDKNLEKIINHIKSRNSKVIVCGGDVRYVRKIF
ncbi:MAG: hypothetical protein K0M56_04510 [Kaistella sp.]|nr:hypothetical protein [Kaistella sp.]